MIFRECVLIFFIAGFALFYLGAKLAESLVDQDGVVYVQK